jgi:hypothetical protein
VADADIDLARFRIGDDGCFFLQLALQALDQVAYAGIPMRLGSCDWM